MKYKTTREPKRFFLDDGEYDDSFEFVMKVVTTNESIINKNIKPMIKNEYKNMTINNINLFTYCEDIIKELSLKEKESLLIYLIGIDFNKLKTLKDTYPNIITNDIVNKVYKLNINYINSLPYYDKKLENIEKMLKENPFNKNFFTLFLIKKIKFLSNNKSEDNILKLEELLFNIDYLIEKILINSRNYAELLCLYKKSFEFIYSDENIEKLLEYYKNKYNMSRVTYYTHNKTIFIENNLEEWFAKLDFYKNKINLYHSNEKYSKGYHRQEFELKKIDLNELFYYVFLHQKNKVNRDYNKVNRLFKYIENERSS